MEYNGTISSSEPETVQAAKATAPGLDPGCVHTRRDGLSTIVTRQCRYMRWCGSSTHGSTISKRDCSAGLPLPGFRTNERACHRTLRTVCLSNFCHDSRARYRARMWHGLRSDQRGRGTLSVGESVTKGSIQFSNNPQKQRTEYSQQTANSNRFNFEHDSIGRCCICGGFGPALLPTTNPKFLHQKSQ